MQGRTFRTWPRARGRLAPAPVTVAQAVGITIELGSFMAVGVVLGLIGGRWLDERLGTGVLFTFAGVIVGLACAGLGTLRQYRTAARHRAAELAAAAATPEATADDQRTAPASAASAGQ
ncbi:MAG: AtpZ/AtpI family protein [Chloroflexota bacterium]